MMPPNPQSFHLLNYFEGPINSIFPVFLKFASSLPMQKATYLNISHLLYGLHILNGLLALDSSNTNTVNQNTIFTLISLKHSHHVTLI